MLGSGTREGLEPHEHLLYTADKASCETLARCSLCLAGNCSTGRPDLVAFHEDEIAPHCRNAVINTSQIPFSIPDFVAYRPVLSKSL